MNKKTTMTLSVMMMVAGTSLAAAPLTTPFQSYGLGENYYMGNHAEQIVIDRKSVV